MKSTSPYLAHPKRLADVVALLQVMGAYSWSSRTIARWTTTMGTDPVSADSWEEIIRQHPEFFRLKDTLATLVWRRAYQKNYYPERGVELSPEEMANRENLSENERPSLTRKPLTDDQIFSLIESAIKFQSAAIAYNQESRWPWVIGTGIVSAVIGFLIKASL